MFLRSIREPLSDGRLALAHQAFDRIGESAGGGVMQVRLP